MNKVSFNKENPVDLFSQLVKVLSRKNDKGQMESLIQQLKEISSKIFSELNTKERKNMTNLDKIVDDVLKTAANKTLMLLPGVTLNIRHTKDQLGFRIDLQGTFMHGGATIDEVIKKLQACFKEISID